MAFESLGDKFQRILKKVKGQAKLTEKNMEDMLREVRIALLEADVNYKIVREFVNEVKEKSIGQKFYVKIKSSDIDITDDIARNIEEASNIADEYTEALRNSG